MPKIKTSSTSTNNNGNKGGKGSNNVTKLLEQTNRSLTEISSALKVQIASAAQNQKAVEAERKHREKVEKEAEKRRKENAAKVKSTSNNQKDHSLRDEVWNGVMPHDRRQFAGSTMIGAALGMDPAIVQAIGLDKVGAAFWKKGKSTVGGALSKLKGNNNNSTDEKGKTTKGAYGSVTEAGTPVTRRLDTIIKLLGGKPPKEKAAKEEKKEDSFFGKLLGGMGKLLLPLLAAGLMAMIKPFVEKLLNKLFNSMLGDELGGVASGIIADMLPGAIAGYIYSKKVMGKGSWQAVLIGGGISLAYYTIKRKIQEFMGAINGDPKEIKATDYLDMAIRGALIGASVTKFGQGSFKAAMLGAGIATGIQWIINRVGEVKQILDGKSVDLKDITIGGITIPESTFGAMVSGAMIGHKFGGWEGAIVGALIGGGIGTLWASVVDFRNKLNAAKTGKYEPPAEINGVPYSVAAGLIGGAGIGYKFGGFWPGMIVGALIGGLAGWIANEVQKYITKSTADEANATKTLNGNESFQQINSVNQKDLAILNDPNASAIEKQKAKQRLELAEKTKTRATNALAGFEQYDKDKNGILDDNEIAKLNKGIRLWGKDSIGARWINGKHAGDLQEEVQRLQAAGYNITKENLMMYEANNLAGTQNSMNNVMNIANGLPSVPMQTSYQMSTIQQQETQTKLATATEKLAKLFEDAAKEDGFGNTTTYNAITTSSGSNIDVYASGSASQSSMGG